MFKGGAIEKKRLILVDGCRGHTGSFLIRELLNLYPNVKIVATDLPPKTREKVMTKEKVFRDNVGSSQEFLQDPRVEFIPSDLTKPETLLPLFEGKNYDVVFHPASLYDYFAELDLLRKINVKGTDDQQIEKVFLLYASNSPKSWNIIEMSVVGNNEYLAIIPGQSGGTVLYYQIYAFDNDSHLKIEDNNGNYYVIEYQTPSFPSLSPLFIFIILGVIAICVAGTSVGFLKFRKRKKRIEKQNEKFETKFVKPDLEEDEPTSAPN